MFHLPRNLLQVPSLEFWVVDRQLWTSAARI